MDTLKSTIQLYYPIKPVHINQAFGQNMNSYYREKGLLGHQGIDFRAFHGQPIFAAHDGICLPEIDDHGGNGVVIVSSDGTYKTLYWHLIDDDAVVDTGQKVKAGELIGYADNTGQSTGDHLHFGLCFFPQDFNNGYGGYTDPQPYFNGKYAEDINNPPAPLPKFQFTKTLKMGSWNKEVRELQSFLKGVNLYSGVVDGIYGKVTMASVIAFQKANNLQADGVVGQLTRKRLNEFLI